MNPTGDEIHNDWRIGNWKQTHMVASDEEICVVELFNAEMTPKLVLGYSSGTVDICSIIDHQLQYNSKKRFAAHKAAPSAFWLSGTEILSCDCLGNIRSWSAGQGPVSAILRYQQFIVSASPEKGLITLWQENGSVVSVIRELNTKPSEDIYLVAHEPSNLLVSATRNGWITAWDMTAKSRIAEHKPTSMMKIDSITLTSTSPITLVVSDYDGIVSEVQFSGEKFSLTADYAALPQHVNAMIPMPARRVVVCASPAGHLSTFDFDFDKEYETAPNACLLYNILPRSENPINLICASSDTLVSVSDANEINIFHFGAKEMTLDDRKAQWTSMEAKIRKREAKQAEAALNKTKQPQKKSPKVPEEGDAVPLEGFPPLDTSHEEGEGQKDGAPSLLSSTQDEENVALTSDSNEETAMNENMDDSEKMVDPKAMSDEKLWTYIAVTLCMACMASGFAVYFAGPIRL